ncbi:hypothetical protein PanWU01x14_074490 [Parasponia andersonii]|uniref:Uncharacterized protein n=1 Tax=Parasponia andersonii TaxID=3476 RepID=A0A2P5DDF3_PARAD|nr:hypothetical protein PanWU01x14_074490 [Parasponia andersonii]
MSVVFAFIVVSRRYVLTFTWAVTPYICFVACAVDSSVTAVTVYQLLCYRWWALVAVVKSSVANGHFVKKIEFDKFCLEREWSRSRETSMTVY